MVRHWEVRPKTVAAVLNEVGSWVSSGGSNAPLDGTCAGLRQLYREYIHSVVAKFYCEVGSI